VAAISAARTAAGVRRTWLRVLRFSARRHQSWNRGAAQTIAWSCAARSSAGRNGHCIVYSVHHGPSNENRDFTFPVPWSGRISPCGGKSRIRLSPPPVQRESSRLAIGQQRDEPCSLSLVKSGIRQNFDRAQHANVDTWWSCIQQLRICIA
jgi:hypothetical protein